MKRTVTAVLAALAVALPGLAAACDAHEGSAQLKKLTIPELATLATQKKATAVDANNATTRTKWGVIPGAVLLTSSAGYDPTKELPAAKDTKLVFYCANTRCTASQSAAKKALAAGYTDVAVLPDGIQGWKGAGQPVSQPQS